MKVINILWTLTVSVLSGLLLAGCGNDELGGDPVEGGRSLSIRYEIEGMETETRATPANDMERKVNNVHILFYDSGESYVTSQSATVLEGSSSFSFTVPTELAADTQYKTLIVANAEGYVPSEYSSFDSYIAASTGLTYSEMQQELYAQGAIDIADNGLPMWGEFQDAEWNPVDFSYSQSGSAITFTGTCHFSRSVSRLDLRHLAANRLIIEKVKVCNYRKAGYYFHNDAPKGEICTGIGESAWTGVADTSGNVQEVKAKLYAYSNIVPVVSQNDAQTTYIMIAGYYQDSTNNTTTNPTNKLTYYRFNMAKNGGSQILRRNCRYVAIINSVNGPGKDSEQEANDSETPMLGYTVEDGWAEDDGGTVITDDKGNYLTVSRAMITFQGEIGLTESVKVNVKDGLTWTASWDTSDPLASDYGKFEFSTADNTAIAVTTLDSNRTDFLRTARLQVKASGGTVDASNPLIATIDVMQLSSSEEARILLVDGNLGTIQQAVPGIGATLRFQVQTGSRRCTWSAADVDNSSANLGVSWNTTGANYGSLEVDVPTNTSSGERTFSIRVYRILSTGSTDTEVDPVTIVFTQPKSDYLLTVTPTPSQTSEGVVLEGFSSATGNVNGVSAQKSFTVTLADAEHYTYSIKSTFAKDYDLYLSTGPNAPGTTSKRAEWTNGFQTDSIGGLTSGTRFWLNAFRTGPGDPTIRGTITVYAKPKTDGYIQQSYSFNVSIKTSCVVGDALLPFGSNYILVPDRNIGADKRFVVQDGTKRFVTARNFTNDGKVNITGSSQRDSLNTNFKGGYYSWYSRGSALSIWLSEDDDQTNMDEDGTVSPFYKSADKGKWYVPSKNEIENIGRRLVFSKQRVFVVSNAREKLTGNYVGCYYPLAGLSSDPSSVNGFYWSSIGSSDYHCAYYLQFNPSSYNIPKNGNYDTYRYSIRCVRSVSSAEYTAYTQ